MNLNKLLRHRQYLMYWLTSRIRKLLRLNTGDDECDWEVYHHHYQAEQAEIEKVNTLVLSPGDYAFSGGSLFLESKILPLHPNYRLLYETILQLNPRTVLEIGCGGGDHLFNLNVLAPAIGLYGRDRSAGQLAFLRRRHPGLRAEIAQLDVTLPYSTRWPVVELAFTQAVIMHIHTGNDHYEAISNLLRTATKYVVLMENWERHNFMQIINELRKTNRILWKELFFYYRRSPELDKPHLMVVSSVELPYETLTDYNVLRAHVSNA